MYHAKIRHSNFGFFKTHPIIPAHVLNVDPGLTGRLLEDGVGSDNLEIDPLSEK